MSEDSAVSEAHNKRDLDHWFRKWVAPTLMVLLLGGIYTKSSETNDRLIEKLARDEEKEKSFLDFKARAENFMADGDRITPEKLEKRLEPLMEVLRQHNINDRDFREDIKTITSTLSTVEKDLAVITSEIEQIKN